MVNEAEPRRSRTGSLESEIAWHIKKKHILIPLNSIRRPIAREWQKTKKTDIAKIKKHVKDGGNVGWVIGEKALVIDVDTKNQNPGVKSMHRLQKQVTLPQANRKIISPSGGYHLYYLEMPADTPIHTKLAEFEGIDFLTGAHYVVIGGSRYGENPHLVDPEKEYQVDQNYVAAREPANPGEQLLELLRQLPPALATPQGQSFLLDAQILLAGLDPSVVSRDHWLQVGMALKHEFGEAGFEAFDEWSKRDGARYEKQRPIRDDWASFKRTTDSGGQLAGMGKLVFIKQHYSPEQLEQRKVEEVGNNPASILLDLENFLESELPPLDFIIGEWFVQASITTIYAKAGVGKTWLTYALARSLITGENFLNHKITRCLDKILIVDGEMPLNLMQTRMKMMLSGVHGIKILSAFSFYDATNQTLDLFNAKHQKVLNRWIKEHGFEMVIFDNRSTLTPNQPENTDENVSQVISWLTTLRNQGVSSVLVHHANKQGTQRGSSKWDGAMDQIIKLEEVKLGKNQVIGGKFHVILEKTRQKRPDEANVMATILEMGDQVRVVVESIDDPELDDDQLQLLQAIHEGKSQKDLVKLLGVSERTVRRACGGLVPLFLTRMENNRGTLSPYELTEKGLKALQGVASEVE